MSTNARFRDQTLDQFIDALASGGATPGGGAAAAVAGSLGAALVAMVASLSEGRPKYADHQDLLVEAKAAGHELTHRLLDLADEDAAAFDGFGAAMRLPRGTDDERAVRTRALQAAARAATDAPFKTVQACLEVAAMAEALAERSNRNASSDLEVAGLMASAAARAAAANVFVNVPSMGDEASAVTLVARTEGMVAEIERLAARTSEVIRAGEARPPLAGSVG